MNSEMTLHRLNHLYQCIEHEQRYSGPTVPLIVFEGSDVTMDGFTGT